MAPMNDNGGTTLEGVDDWSGSLSAMVVEVSGRAGPSRGGMSRTFTVDEVEELLSEGLFVEGGELEGGQQRQGLTMTHLEAALRCGVISPAIHVAH